jgi:hypothetical protein
VDEFYSLPNIIQAMKSRRLRQAGHVACMGNNRNAYRVLMNKLERKRPLRRPAHRRILLKCILKK